MHIQMRVFAAWIFAFAAFILSLLVLTAGSKPGFLEGAAIATTGPDYNYYQWGSLHFLTLCEGNYAADGSQTNITCFGSPSPSSVYPGLEKGFVTWTIGVAFSGLDVLLLPLFFGGRIHWNGWMVFFLVIPWFALALGGAFSTTTGELDLYDSYYPGGPGKLFLPLTWTAVGCILAAMVIEFFEYGLQKFTPPREIIAAKYKPANVRWISYNTSALSRAVQHDAGMVQNNISSSLGGIGF